MPPPTIIQLFLVGNLGGVDNGPTVPTTFTANAPWCVLTITTYHWNNAQGTTPGTIGLQAANGGLFGPWQASGTPVEGGVPNASWTWTVNLRIPIPAGAYTVIDSDPATWAQNDGTGGAGMAWATGCILDTKSGCMGGG